MDSRSTAVFVTLPTTMTWFEVKGLYAPSLPVHNLIVPASRSGLRSCALIGNEVFLPAVGFVAVAYMFHRTPRQYQGLAFCRRGGRDMRAGVEFPFAYFIGKTHAVPWHTPNSNYAPIDADRTPRAGLSLSLPLLLAVTAPSLRDTSVISEGVGIQNPRRKGLGLPQVSWNHVASCKDIRKPSNCDAVPMNLSSE